MLRISLGKQPYLNEPFMVDLANPGDEAIDSWSITF